MERLSMANTGQHTVTPLERIEDRFHLIKELGSGTYGRVMLAKCVQTGRQVALKILPNAKTKEKDFIREYELGRELSRYRYIINTYDDTFATERDWLFSLEYAPFGDLYELISRKLHTRPDGANLGLVELKAKKVFKQVASAISYMHDNKLVHRDVKPENIVLFDRNCDRVKLMDFGMTKPIGTTVRKVSTGIPYTPPEICELDKGDRYTIETGSDAWSYGVLVFCTLTGNFPWQLADSRVDPFYAEFRQWLDSDQVTCSAVQWRHFTPEAMSLFRRMFRSSPSDRSPLDAYEAHRVRAFLVQDTATATTGGATSDEGKQTPAVVAAVEDGRSSLEKHGIKTTVSGKWKAKRITKWLQSL